MHDNRCRSGVAFALAATAALLASAAPLRAETPDDEIETVTDQVELASRATNRVIVPVPLAGPQLGAGVALGAI